MVFGTMSCSRLFPGVVPEDSRELCPLIFLSALVVSLCGINLWTWILGISFWGYCIVHYYFLI